MLEVENFDEIVSLPLLPVLMLSFLSFVVETVFIQFSTLFWRKYFHM